MSVGSAGAARPRLFAVLVVCLSSVLALLLAEGVLRVVRAHSKYYILPPHHHGVFTPSEGILPGVSGNATFSANSDGFRGDELTPAHTYRVLAIGGSTTECLYLDQSEMWTQLVQNALNERLPGERVWVGNAGRPGRHSFHHLTAMRFLPLQELKIDAVVHLVGINDLSVRLSRDTLYDPDFRTRADALETLLAETFVGRLRPYPDDGWLRKTALWQTLRKAGMKVFPKKRPENLQDEEGNVHLRWRKYRREATEIRDELPDLTLALREYSRNLHEIVDVAQAQSVRVIFLTQPALWSASLPEDLEAILWLGGVGEFQKAGGSPYYSAAALERGMALYNATLLEICKDRKVECLDLAAMLPKDTTVFYDDAHFNESGARKVASAVSGYLLERGLRRPGGAR